MSLLEASDWVPNVQANNMDDAIMIDNITSAHSVLFDLPILAEHRSQRRVGLPKMPNYSLSPTIELHDKMHGHDAVEI